ncbi:unnamed protein product, partial [Rotaria sordida]
QYHDMDSATRLFSTITNKSSYICTAMFKGLKNNNMPEKIFDLLDQMTFKPDNYTLPILFNVCAQLANDRAMKIGRKLLDEMPNDYRNNNIILNSAMDMLMKSGDVKSAERIFDSIKKKNIITYGALMNGYNINSIPWKCFKILEEMKQQGVVLNEHAWNILIGTCSKIGMIRESQYIIDQIPLHIRNLKQIQTSLIHMWSKCGSIKMAQNIFKSVHDQDIMIYNAMISGFGLNGMGLEAIELYRKMPNELQNEITHICVLNACSHSGLLDQARNIFNEIPLKTEKIVTAMTDCLSRLFLFDEAEKLIDEYEKTNSPSFIMYSCLLSGVRNNRNKKLSEKIYNRMKSLFPDEKEGLTSSVILVSNLYSSVGEHQQAKEFRLSQIKELGKKVKAGLSWTDGSGEIVAFLANDNSHPQLAEIHDEVNRMTSEVIKLGYKCDSSWVTRELREEETIESALGGHSERLALAFNFIQRPVPDFIQITKNLRICGDCHEYTKLSCVIADDDDDEGAEEVKSFQRMLDYLKETKDVEYFTSLATLMANCSVFDLDTFERCIKAEVLGVGSKEMAGEKNLHDADFIISLFRFCQLLCEGHNLEFQNYLRLQIGSSTNVNIIICTVDYLLSSQESLMDFYWHYSGKETIDAYGKENLCRVIIVAKQVFNTLTEYIQGPCSQNQLALANSRLWDAIAGFFYIFAHMQRELSQDPTQIELLHEFMKLQKDMIIMLLSMLEGNVLNGSNLITSEAFQEYDINKDGFISPKEFRRAMETQKVYTNQDIDYILNCVDINQDGKIDFMEFTERFHNLARDIGFNMAILLTNLSEHMPHDIRLQRLMDKGKSFLSYLQDHLDRIEIKGGADYIERESKKTFLHLVINETDDKEKLEQFINFCEDTIFEMQHAVAISGEEDDQTYRRAKSSNIESNIVHPPTCKPMKLALSYS